MGYVHQMAPRSQEFVIASYRALARGGLSNEIPVLACYADYTVHEYLLGAGTTQVTITFNLISDAMSYDLYLRSHEVGTFGSDPLLSETQLSGIFLRIAYETEKLFAEILEGSETVVFLITAAATNDAHAGHRIANISA